jgi:hypothetical protein
MHLYVVASPSSDSRLLEDVAQPGVKCRHSARLACYMQVSWQPPEWMQ